jgi:iron complex transport system ATP-binding protein
MLQVQAINFKIAPTLSLSDISFDVMPCEMVAILGANGAGKSTLLKIITGSLKADSGSIIINKRQLSDWSKNELANNCAVLLQQNPLQLSFTIAEVVMMGRYPHFKNHASLNDERIVLQVLKKTGITHLKDRNYLTLSGGEQQRVHIARVLAQVSDQTTDHPRYLFMDEPSNNLDIRHQHATLQLAKDFAEEGNCVIAVLHDLNLALQYADKIVLLKDGMLKGFGLPDNIMTDDSISDVYGLPLQIFNHPSSKYRIVMPATKHSKIKKINQAKICPQ